MPRNPDFGGAALKYAVEYGWAVFPLKPRDKVPLAGTRGFHDATTNAEQIAAWWQAHPDANVGIATGQPSGIVVVDVDGEAGEAALAALCPTLPLTPVSQTGKGRHLVFARPDGGLRNSAGKLGPQLDVRGDGGYIVAPPSIHPNGHAYQWDRATQQHPMQVEPAALPDAILAKLTTPVLALPTAPQSDAREIPLRSEIPEGGRNDALSRVAGRLLAKGMGELETLEYVRGVNATKMRPPLPADEVERIVASIAATDRRNRGRDWMPSEPAVKSPAPSLVRIDAALFQALGERNTAPIDAVPTMLAAWNDACRGFGGSVGLARGWHITIGGASGTGKSLLALNLVASAIAHGRKVGYVSLEMSTDQLTSRLLAMVGGESVRGLEPGALYSPAAWQAATTEFQRLCMATGGGLWIAERPSNDLASVMTCAQQAVDDGAALVVVDYMQLVHVPHVEGIAEQMRKVSAAVQQFAFRHNVTTVGLSQFNRATSFNKDSEPTAQGLTGSSALENDSDQVVLLDHSANQRQGTTMDTNVLVAKNRHGPVAKIPVRWDYTTLRVREREVAMSDKLASEQDTHGIRTTWGVA